MQRVLAIAPTSRGFAFAVLESSERLVDWGMVDTKGKDLRRIESRLREHLLRLEPSLIAVREISNKRQWVARVNARAEALAKKGRIAVRVIPRPLLTLCSACSTRKEAAEYLARLFPALRRYVPGDRKIWIGEDERMAIFEAVATGLLALS